MRTTIPAVHDLVRFREVYADEHASTSADPAPAREMAWYRSYAEPWGVLRGLHAHVARHPLPWLVLFGLAFGSRFHP